jgi:transcriptional regulator with XRE-family HTH domain
MGDVELGARLRKARESQGLKQSEVLEKLNISKVQSLSAYETGKSNPTLDTLRKMSELYKISTDELLFGEKRDFTDNSFYRKKDSEYFLKLVECVDKLGLSLIPLDNSEYPDYAVSLTKYHHDQENVIRFVHSWKKFRDLLDQGIIDEFDYIALLERKVSELGEIDLKRKNDPYFL